MEGTELTPPPTRNVSEIAAISGLKVFFNKAHVQTKGVYKIFGVPERSQFTTKPPGSYKFCGFSFRKNQERASKFGSILGLDQGLMNNCSAAAVRAPNSEKSSCP